MLEDCLSGEVETALNCVFSFQLIDFMSKCMIAITFLACHVIFDKRL